MKIENTYDKPVDEKTIELKDEASNSAEIPTSVNLSPDYPYF